MSVFVADEQGEPLATEPLRRLADHVLRSEGYPGQSELSLILVDSRQIAEYNRRFMGRDGPTDVLAFPLETLQPGRPPAPQQDGPPLNLGDVVIAPSIVREQAADHGVRFEDEMALMVVHGVLHLMGYDHADDDDADFMERRERELLSGKKRHAR